MTGDAEPVGLGALTGEGRRPGDNDYVSAAYRPIATADWTDYRLRATADGLRATTNSVGITVRSDSGHPVTLSVGRNTATLVARGRAGADDRSSCGLDPAAGHDVDVSVTPERVRVEVDGRHCATARAGGWPEAEGAGGFSLSVRTGGPDGPWPRFTALKVE